MFIESPRFPEDVSRGSTSEPTYQTSVVEAYSGAEQRNSNWIFPIYEFDVTRGMSSAEHLTSVVRFFHVAKGRAYAFRYKDWTDFKSRDGRTVVGAGDQAIGTGNGVLLGFQLVKKYAVGLAAQTRKISKPVIGSVVVALNGVQTTAFTVDHTTGLVTMTVAPLAGVLVTAGFEFDVPVRFFEDKVITTIDVADIGTQQIRLREVRV